MHPAISYQLTQARTADLRQHAQQAALARAARTARQDQRRQTAPLLPSLLSRLMWRTPSHRTVQAPPAGPGVAAPLPHDPGPPNWARLASCHRAPSSTRANRCRTAPP